MHVVIIIIRKSPISQTFDKNSLNNNYYKANKNKLKDCKIIPKTNFSTQLETIHNHVFYLKMQHLNLLYDKNSI